MEHEDTAYKEDAVCHACICCAVPVVPCCRHTVASWPSDPDASAFPEANHWRSNADLLDPAHPEQHVLFPLHGAQLQDSGSIVAALFEWAIRRTRSDKFISGKKVTGSYRHAGHRPLRGREETI